MTLPMINLANLDSAAFKGKNSFNTVCSNLAIALAPRAYGGQRSRTVLKFSTQFSTFRGAT